jgi:hypothetical protein
MIALLIVGLLQPDWAGWQEFDHRPNGFGDTAFLFDGSSRRRSGNFASAWVTYDFHYSGRNPTTHIELWELDCLQRRSRARSGFVLDGDMPASMWRRARLFRAITGDSPQAALAARICDSRPGGAQEPTRESAGL